MKSNKVYINTTFKKKYISIDSVFEAYESEIFGSIVCPKWVPSGFYCKTLTFDQWFEYYNIGVY